MNPLDVEKWLDSNETFFREYFLKNGDLGLVNAWLTDHGFLVIREGNSLVPILRSPDFLGPSDYRYSVPPIPISTSSSRRASGASGNSGGTVGSPLSPGDRLNDFSTTDEDNTTTTTPTTTTTITTPTTLLPSTSTGGLGPSTSSGHCRRSNSKRCLRNDFARAKSRSVYQTQDGSCSPSSPGGGAGGACGGGIYLLNTSASRRSSLKDMRKYTSLPPNSINILSLLIESKVKLPRCESKKLEIKRELRKIDERAFFLDVVKDIANDLDLKSLTKKITENISVLLDAEAASLFLIEGPKGKQTLVSKVFDFPCGAQCPLPIQTDDSSVSIPWGKGILGWVAENGETVNLETAHEDPRYNDGVDQILHTHTDSLLCMAVRNSLGAVGAGGSSHHVPGPSTSSAAASSSSVVSISPPGEDEIIAVAQVVNKNPSINDGTFNRDDEKLLETYLQFVGIAITNAQIMEATRREYERNRNLLEVVHDLFEEQTSLEKVILKIMERAQRLLKCERASVLLLDENSSQELVFSKIFELSLTINNNGEFHEGKSEALKAGKLRGMENSPIVKFAEKVVGTGQVINIAERVEIEPASIYANIKSLLAMAIRNRHGEIIGVATIINKLNNLPFNDHDEQLFEAFTIFCGLGINNTLTYGELEMAIARQKVAIEVLSYHATASMKEVETIMKKTIPTADEYQLCSLLFDDFSLDRDEMVLGALRMFQELGLVSRFKIDYTTLCRFLLTVQKNYRDVPYHNWRHAFNVSQSIFAILISCEMKNTFTEYEVFAMFVACICHDLDHRGTNNSFQAKTGSALALLYGTTNTMEHHHFNHSVMIINSEGHNIFSGLSSDHYSRVMNILKQCILATDLTIYFQKRTEFFNMVESGSYSWEREEQREILRSMLMTASDLAASTKPWKVQRRVAELVTAEFFAQGDQERQQLQITPPASMDREREDELPNLQIRWISDICLPLYQSLTTMNPKFEIMRVGTENNMKQWETLAQGTSRGVVAGAPLPPPPTVPNPAVAVTEASVMVTVPIPYSLDPSDPKSPE